MRFAGPDFLRSRTCDARLGDGVAGAGDPDIARLGDWEEGAASGDGALVEDEEWRSASTRSTRD